MANPRPHPFVRFSTELYRAILLAPFSATQQSIVLAVVLKTYGDYGRTDAPISVGLLARLTGHDRGHISRSLVILVKEGVIHRISRGDRDHTAQVLALNNDYEHWGRFAVSAESVALRATVAEGQPLRTGNRTVAHGTTEPLRTGNRTVAPRTTEPLRTGNRTVAPRTTTIDTEIENTDTSFEAFWSAYPRHVRREEAEALFAELSPAEQAQAVSAAEHRASYDRDQGTELQYVPYPTTFLRGDFREWQHGPPAGLRAAQSPPVEPTVLVCARCGRELHDDDLADALPVERPDGSTAWLCPRCQRHDDTEGGEHVSG